LSEEKDESIVNKKVSRRSMLKWTAGLAAAGVVGLAIGYGSDELLRSTGVVQPEVVTKVETVPNIEEQVLSTTTIGGPLWAHVRNGRLAWVEPLRYTKEDATPWSWTINGKTISPMDVEWGGTEKRMISISQATAALRAKLYSPDRPRYPMKRVGFAPGGKSDISNRGKGEFVRISWEEAYSIMTSEIQRILEKYGNAGIQSY
jgi:anaerobic selenocysteine-containing dehydrogenase